MENLKKHIIQKSPKPILDINFTYNSLLISYELSIDNFYNAKLAILECLETVGDTSKATFRKVTLPVCYYEDFGLDLQELSQNLDLDISEIIRLHSSTEYLVCFLGFLPGFPYLNNLPKSLHHERKKTPRQRIEKGAVGIGGKQTGIYPQESPGGWQIIGNCPVDLYGASWPDNVLLRPTDVLTFEAISIAEHERIKKHFSEGKYTVKIETHGAA